MFIKLFSQLLLLFLAGISLGNAEQTYTEADIHAFESASPCANAKAYDGDYPVYFLYHKFPDGLHDLAIAKSNAEGTFEIKRVTFNGNKTLTCDYKSLAIVRGGGWGWHLAWQKKDDNVLRYARIDGEAWVTSPTKKLTTQFRSTYPPTIFTLNQQVWMVWLEQVLNANDVYAVYSDDEGRNWRDVSLIAQVDKAVTQLQFVEKQNQVYLDGRGLAAPLLLE